MINNKSFLEWLLRVLAVSFIILVFVIIVIGKTGGFNTPVIVPAECTYYNTLPDGNKTPENSGLLLLTF